MGRRVFGRFTKIEMEGLVDPSREQARFLIFIILFVTAIFAATDLIWLLQSTLSLDPANLLVLTKVAPFIIFLYVVSAGVSWRVKDDTSAIARYIRRAAQFVRLMAVASALFIPLAIATGIFVYLASATDRPLVDGHLAKLDAALGFDWVSFLRSVNGSQLLSEILQVAYHSLGPQVPLLFLLLGVTLRRQRILEFLAVLAISSLLIGIGMVAYPAAGAYAYFQPPSGDFSNFSADAGMWHFTDLQKLRSGEPFRLLLDRMQGLVTFPSFHTTLGILVVYAVRDFKVLTISVGALNAVMIVSTLPEGGHHLVDVLAGAGIGLASILAVRYAVRNRQHSVLLRGASA